MNKNSKTKQQLLLEIEELRTRLDAGDQRFQETHETLQALAQKYAESIVETVREPLVVLASSLKVISANRSFYETFQVTPRETEGRSLFDIGNHQWDIPSLRDLLEKTIPQNTHFSDFEVEHDFPAIGRRTMLLNARRIYREGQGTDTILLAIEDMTEHKAMEEALKISETRYRRLFEAAQDGILILDAETGQISDVNPFLVEMLGYSHEDFLGKKLWEIGAFKDIEASKAAFMELQNKGYVRYNDLPLETKDGRPMAVEFVSNIYLVNHHKVIQCNIRDTTERKLIAEALRKAHNELERRVEERTTELRKVNEELKQEIKERKKIEETLRESEKQLRYLSSRLLTAEETERRRISRELHDELGGALAVLKLRLSSTGKNLGENQLVLREELGNNLKYIDEIIESVDRLSRDLSPSIVEDLGLSAGLRWLTDNYAKNYRAKVTFDIVDIDHLFLNESQIRIYRILQEALTNVGKHAQAKNVSVIIKENEDGISFALKDDGRGFDYEQVVTRDATERGLGLVSMEERVRMLGGSLDLRSQEGKGTRITFTIPTKRGEIL
jgi:PAS domain S-box-containing protein